MTGPAVPQTSVVTTTAVPETTIATAPAVLETTAPTTSQALSETAVAVRMCNEGLETLRGLSKRTLEAAEEWVEAKASGNSEAEAEAHRETFELASAMLDVDLGTCPSGNSAAESAEQMRRGAALGAGVLVAAACPDNYEHAGEEYTFRVSNPRPDGVHQVDLGVLESECGPRFVVAECPDDYEHAGKEYAYLEDRTSAQRKHCGKRFERGRWRVRTIDDPVRGDIGSQAVLSGHWVGTPDWLADEVPQMGIQCQRDKLGVWVRTGGYVGAKYGRGVPVEYRLGEWIVTEEWGELISGSDESAGAFIQSWQRREFVSRLREAAANTETTFTISITGYDGAKYGSARFDLTGIELRVEPILQECGW
ncbi:hypothetical protein [Candidatus Poriferisodalis sp.]|uniref:hypothetical protein n=1 Tax=Candidatus Poriferisodalis sp. TaxID=3101277 RepID=UPI003B0218E1